MNKAIENPSGGAITTKKGGAITTTPRYINLVSGCCRRSTMSLRFLFVTKTCSCARCQCEPCEPQKARERPSATILLVRISGKHADNAPDIIYGSLETHDIGGLHIADTKWYLYEQDNGTFIVAECETNKGKFSCLRERVGNYTTKPIFTKTEGTGPQEIVGVEHREDGTIGINDMSLHYISNSNSNMWRLTRCTKSTTQGSTGPLEKQSLGESCILIGWYVATHSTKRSSVASEYLVKSSVHRLI